MSSNHEKALACSQRAVLFEQSNCYDAASFYYQEAAKYLYLAVTSEDCSNADRRDWTEKCRQYDNRAVLLKQKVLENETRNFQSINNQVLQRCNFLFEQALNADEKGHHDIAVELYTKNVEYILRMTSNVEDDTVKKKLRKRADQALSRAEELKKLKRVSKDSKDVTIQKNIPSTARDDTEMCESISTIKVSDQGNTSYSSAEKKVLLSTSKINGIDYVPFMEIDLKERFQYAIPFTDRDGRLKLAPKQLEHFSTWSRPEEIFSEPKMIFKNVIDYRSIKQTIISDCSFVASLAVSALYEERFSKRLISSIIYPRNKNKEPIYNPFGKYMVKLHLNGVLRKVIIDDELPTDKYGNLLCSYSMRKGELWVSLLEKAYMKVMGGYNFPGSNSNIDLHALTGWIPERIPIRPNEKDFNADLTFTMMVKRLDVGHCIGTVATGNLSSADEERSGLVPIHAYAILKAITYNGVRLLQLKNPWSHLRWKGNYSELDLQHWTRELRNALNFDPDNAASFDNGIFWIDYESILKFFDVFYLNWNPDIFQFTYCTHGLWSAGQGPTKDVYNMGENPQFKLHIPGTKPGSVWVLLSRHITNIKDFENNCEFIALLVYKNNGNKIYYPADPPPFIDGVRINSPHYLCKILLTETSQRTYTLVISQYEKTTNIFFTLRAYSTLPFSLTQILSEYKYIKKLSGEWKGETAGGCGNYPETFPKNPVYYLQVDSANAKSLLIELRGPKQYNVGFVMQRIGGDEQAIRDFGRKTPGPYRSGFVVLELENVLSATYTITPTTFLPKQEGPFILTVKSTCAISLKK